MPAKVNPAFYDFLDPEADYEGYSREVLGKTDDCIPTEVLVDFSGGECAPEVAARVQKHLDTGCGYCCPFMEGCLRAIREPPSWVRRNVPELLQDQGDEPPKPMSNGVASAAPAIQNNAVPPPPTTPFQSGEDAPAA